MSDMDRLTQSGDPLERAIIRLAGEELQSVLDPYAQIWAKYVVPDRITTGEFVGAVSLEFAASHYTALVRLYNAWGFREAISQTCAESTPEDDGALLLKLQASTAAFWWSLGATVDNLGKALEEFPGSPLKERDAGVRHLSNEIEYVRYLYGRRTQLIHSRIIPIGTVKGYPVSDSRYLDGPHRMALPGETNWKRDFNSPQDLDRFYDDRWKEALKELASAWWKVKSSLDGIKPPKRSATPVEGDKLIAEYFGRVQKPAPPVTTVYASGYVPPPRPLYPDGPGPSGMPPAGGGYPF